MQKVRQNNVLLVLELSIVALSRQIAAMQMKFLSMQPFQKIT